MAELYFMILLVTENFITAMLPFYKMLYIQKSSSIFLIVVNLNNNKENVEQNVLYWLSFLQNNITIAECKSHVIIIGSHADISLATGEDPKQKISEISNLIRKLPNSSTTEFVGMYPIDCRYSEFTGMDELRSSLKNSCTSLRRVDTISFNAHCFHVFLLDRFRVSVAVNIKDLQTEIQKVNEESKKGCCELSARQYSNSHFNL